jgi:pSer/pThr/pTyr-binding forkhead associated (FHA) protein
MEAYEHSDDHALNKTEASAFLFVEKAEPDEVGRTFRLAEALVLGGCWGRSYQPDIGFKDRHVSRRHASIVYAGGQFVLTDLHSTTGTLLNGEPVTKGMPYVLKNDDKIDLADGAVILRFCQEWSACATEMTPVDTTHEASPVGTIGLPARALVVHDERKEVLVEGKKLKQMKGDSLEYRLLFLLYQNQGRAVCYQTMREWVWPDRKVVDRDSGCVSCDVDLSEIEQVVYRLRRKLGEFGACVQNVPRFGYMIDLGHPY